MILLVLKQYKLSADTVACYLRRSLGKSRAAKTIHGGSAFVIPLIQDYAYLSLEPIQIEAPLRGALGRKYSC